MGKARWASAGAVLACVVLAGCGATPAEPTPTPPASQPADTPPKEERLAATLARAERALADPGTSDVHRTHWAHRQQRAYRELAEHPGWRDDVRARVPKRLRAAYDLTLHAAVELHHMSAGPSKIPDDWRIEAPPPVGELRRYYGTAQAKFGVPWQVLAAINFVETRFGRIHGDSSAGAQGPMQFMPATWRVYGRGDIDDPRDAIQAAARYLAASGAPGDLRGALYAYNHSDHYVEAILAYAEAMRRYPHYLGVYHRWQVYYATPHGDVVLEEGYGS